MGLPSQSNVQAFPSYHPNLFVERDAFVSTLLDTLLTDTTDPLFKRSLILEGSPKGGKTWTLEHTHFRAASRPEPVLVLLIKSMDVQDAFELAGERFTPILAELWRRVVRYTQSLPAEQRLPVQSDTQLEQELLDVRLESVLYAVSQIQPAPYLLLLCDGIDEIDLNTTATIDDLLYLFEERFIEPLFEYQNVRLLATRRADGRAQWGTYTVKTLTKRIPLPSFSAAAATEQVARLDPDLGSIAPLQSHVGTYNWNNPGANAYLAQHYDTQRDVLPGASISDCINLLIGSTLSPKDNQWMRALISAEDIDMEQPQPVSAIGQTLARLGMLPFGMVAVRDAFLSRLHNYGVGILQGRMFKTYPEIVALVRATKE